MRKFLFSTICGGLLIASLPGLVQARFNDDPPAAMPTTPALPTASADSSTAAKTVAPNDAEARAAGVLKVAQANKDWSQIYFLSSGETLPNTLISHKWVDAKIKDVLKDMFDQAKISYIFDADIPEDESISVELRQVDLTDALNGITQLMGLQWQIDIRQAGQAANAVVRIRKKVVAKSPESSFNIESWKFTPSTSRTAIPDTAAVKLLHELQANNDKFFQSTINLGTPYLDTPYTRVFRSRETRSTFTCPNCHNQVTIIRKNVEAKCPTCQRTFEPGWKVCPFDGTKRPEAKDDWKFCPICGKPIPDGVATVFSEPTDESPLLSYEPFLTAPQMTAPLVAPAFILPTPPSIDYK